MIVTLKLSKQGIFLQKTIRDSQHNHGRSSSQNVSPIVFLFHCTTLTVVFQICLKSVTTRRTGVGREFSIASLPTRISRRGRGKLLGRAPTPLIVWLRDWAGRSHYSSAWETEPLVVGLGDGAGCLVLHLHPPAVEEVGQVLVPHGEAGQAARPATHIRLTALLQYLKHEETIQSSLHEKIPFQRKELQYRITQSPYR